jgi:DNA replication and repair protein RecF
LHLSELSSQGFRNLSSVPVSFGEGVTLIAGENAQGKTNVLEAVALVCGQRSFRGASPAEMSRDGESFSVTAEVCGRTGADRIGVSWSRQGGRVFERSGKTATFRDISATAPAVFLGPDHRALIAGSPVVRRRFLDRLVLGVRPAGGDDLARYATALRERNALLARERRSRVAPEPGELETWTEELCAAGAAVRRHRLAALRAWETDFLELASETAGDYADIRVAISAEDDSVEALRTEFERVAYVERRRGYSLAGPHRDDLKWSRRGAPLAAQASSGEISRTVAIAKLAEWRAVARAGGEAPLFAADDFDAGLSEAWAAEFLERLPENASVLLTSAAPPQRFGRRLTAVLEMRAGHASPPRALRAVTA